MLKFLLKNGLVIGIIILFVGISVIPSTWGIKEYNNSLHDSKTENYSEEISSADSNTEYWALLIAVGIYAGHPDEDRPSMLDDVKNLHDKLLVSEHWKEDHIKSITAENCTVLNIIKGLRWLDRMDDKDDFSLVYITTHGYPLGFDIPPRDEEDKQDEALVSYKGFKHPWAIIWDDLLNLLLSLLNSKGVCVIVDSCYSGGFNDPPYFQTRMKNNKMNANEWMHEFAEDISESGRVVLMSCSEDEVSYASVFSRCLDKALTGYADINKDDMVSAEEAFEYIVENLNEPDMHPTIYDGYPGELQLTEVEFPPSKPVTPKGQILGETNTTYKYTTFSTDPEGGKISYGWDLDGDFTVDEWTDPLDCNTTVNISHSWAIEGTYNIRVKTKDDHGLISAWSNHIVVMMCSDNIPDQWQVETDYGCWINNEWIAQSFVPSLDTLSKVVLALRAYGAGDPKPLQLIIRDSLNGNNLTESSLAIPELGGDKWAWYTFDFEDIDVIPGETYYVICKGRSDWTFNWKWKRGNPYTHGEIFWSEDGKEWHDIFPDDADGCFVTWAEKPGYPIVFNPIPGDGDSWVPIDVSQLSFNLSDYQGDIMNYTVETVPDIGTGNGFNVNEGKYSIEVSGLECETDYHWFVNVTDGEYWTSEVFGFKTQPIMVFDPFDEGWQYRKKITIDHNKVAGNLTNFPVLISVVDDDLKNKVQGDGDDILFMDNFGVANRIVHEIESFDGSSGELVAWVNVTSISGSVDTVFYIYYGNPNCGSQQYPDRVWDSDFIHVWHLGDSLVDSSGFDDGNDHGTSIVYGKIGKGRDFEQDEKDYVDFGDMSQPGDSSLTTMTWEGWVKPEILDIIFMTKYDTSGTDYVSYHLDFRQGGKFGIWCASAWGVTTQGMTDNSYSVIDEWIYLTATFNLGGINDLNSFINGNEVDFTQTTNDANVMKNIPVTDELGRCRYEAGTGYTDGIFDEVRWSKVVRSDDWIKTSFNTMNDPSSFINVGPEESGP